MMDQIRAGALVFGIVLWPLSEAGGLEADPWTCGLSVGSALALGVGAGLLLGVAVPRERRP